MKEFGISKNVILVIYFEAKNISRILASLFQQQMLQLIEFDYFISTWQMTTILSKKKLASSLKDEMCEIFRKKSL